MPEFSLIIKDQDEIKEQLDINITRLARRTGYSVSHVSRVISRETQPSVECLVALASELHMSIDRLHTLITQGELNVKRS